MIGRKRRACFAFKHICPYNSDMTMMLSVVALAVFQGLAELLPISSSAHVIVAEKLLGIDPTTPETTLLLVMLHTGTMVAVIAYFWRSWKNAYFSHERKHGGP